MRGSPPLHLALFLIGFAFLAVPLVKLTSAPAARTAFTPVAAVVSEKVPVLVRLRFAHPPVKVRLALGSQILVDGPVQSPHELTHEIKLPPDGIELSLSATWPDGTPDTAVTVELEPDALDARSETRWSIGPSLEEVIPFVWRR